jgi:uncharacterized protein (TIGR03435 family)
MVKNEESVQADIIRRCSRICGDASAVPDISFPETVVRRDLDKTRRAPHRTYHRRRHPRRSLHDEGGDSSHFAAKRVSASFGQPVAPLKVIGGPVWMDNDRYDIQATANCGGGALSREQVQLMIQSILEDRFQLKAHMDTREGAVYNLVVAKNPPKIKLSEDQTPIVRRASTPILPCNPVPEPPANPGPPLAGPGQRGNPFDPNNPAPRGFMGMSFSQAGMTLRGSAASISSMLGMLQNYVGNTIIDKTDLKGLYDFAIRFSQEGLVGPDGRPMTPAPAPIPPTGTPQGPPQRPTPFHPFSMPYRNSA